MNAYLALEDGFILEGKSFTGPCESGGEVIFNTGMSGYQEILTDPSYAGQMVCMTWPLIGNYGINAKDMESSKVHVSALLVKEACAVPSNWQATMSLADFLIKHKIPGIEGLDTRALTRHLRINGAMRGIVTTKTSDPLELTTMARSIPSLTEQNLVSQVAPKLPWVWDGNGQKIIDLHDDGSWEWSKSDLVKVAVLDFGTKWNIIRLLVSHGFDPLILPPSTKAEAVLATGAQALFLTNGPGDPNVLTDVIANMQKLIGKLPIAGICLGHQILALALGGKTYKLKFGHHGSNHPVKDLETDKVQISSQNHGFCVDIDSLPQARATHINLNDGTLEGFAHNSLPIMAIQHHPEASPGPFDCRNFFARFQAMAK